MILQYYGTSTSSASRSSTSMHAVYIYIYMFKFVCIHVEFIEWNSIVLPETARYSICVEISKIKVKDI